VLFAATLLALLVVVTVAASPVAAVEGFTFYAVYDLVANPGSLGLAAIEGALMSGNGNRLVVWGRRPGGALALFTLNAGGGDARSIALPPALDDIWDAAIDREGSRAFVHHRWDRAIYKLEHGTFSKIFDADDVTGLGECDQIQVTADGEWVYCREAHHGIWRVNHRGGAPQRILHEQHVRRDGGTAAFIDRFAISADGAAIVFSAEGSRDAGGAFQAKPEIFVQTRSGIWQLTNDRGYVPKGPFTISGDGRTVVYAAGAPQDTIWVAREGRAAVVVERAAGVQHLALDHAGSRLFYYAHASNGRFVDTGGTGGIDLFPARDPGAIALDAPWSLAVSHAGDRISFRNRLGVYVGHFARVDAAAGAPRIEEIRLDPPPTARAAAEKGMTLTARIVDPDGRGDIVRTQANALVDGRVEVDPRRLPLRFSLPLNDAGRPPDVRVGDGTFSGHGDLGARPDALDRTHIRVAAMDRRGTVTVADVRLSSAPATAPIVARRDGAAATPLGSPTPGGPTPVVTARPDASPWRQTTTPYDPACSTGCKEIKHVRDHHGADLHMRVNPNVDDAIAQWGDCLQSFTDCVGKDTTAIAQCVARSACPAPCRAAFASQAAGEGDPRRLLDIFESVFVRDGAMCRPAAPRRAS
jgi:hypothetical protein